MKPANYSPIYCALYPQLTEIAREHGYAMAIHGSMARDMDVICIPWIEQPSEPQTVVDAIVKRFAVRQVTQDKWVRRPHGRVVTTLSLGFGECFMDIGFMPTNKKNTTKSICVHCGKDITHFDGRLWHDDRKIFPQYCYTDPQHGSRLHEPPTGVLHLL